MTKTTVRHVVILGDSLTDRGTMNKRSLFWGLLPLNKFAGLSGKSPVGRFTNGLTWADDIAAIWTDKFIHQDGHKQVTSQAEREALLQNYAYYIDDDLFVRYNGNDFVRSYAEGGLTAHDWKDDYAFMIKHGIQDIKSLIKGKDSFNHDIDHAKEDAEHIATEHIVSTLKQKRDKLFADDVANRYSQKHKADTLVLEWTGANDLITVNDIAMGNPALDETIIDKTVQARLDNVTEMMKHGYKHFMLFELPDLSLTPRYQNASPEIKERIKRNTLLFNQKLKAGLEDIQSANPGVDKQFDVFPTYELFNEIYHNPEKYGFEKDRLAEPYIESEDFKNSPDHTGDCHGHMFWDREHPSARMHELLSERLEQFIDEKYDIEPPKPSEVHDGPGIDTSADELVSGFVQRFVHHAIEDVEDTVNFVKHNPLFQKENQPLTLEKIFHQAIIAADKFVHHVLEDLGWLNQKSKLISPVKSLKEAYEPVSLQAKQTSFKSKLLELKQLHEAHPEATNQEMPLDETLRLAM